MRSVRSLMRYSETHKTGPQRYPAIANLPFPSWYCLTVVPTIPASLAACDHHAILTYRSTPNLSNSSTRPERYRVYHPWA